jgi:hypothetical protein
MQFIIIIIIIIIKTVLQSDYAIDAQTTRPLLQGPSVPGNNNSQ